MKHFMISAALGVVILLSACQKDVIETTLNEQPLVDATVENTDELSLRKSYKSMYQLKDQLSRVIEERDDNQISAAWAFGDNIGLITNAKYALINRVTGEMKTGYLLYADNPNFWYKAPYLEDQSVGEDEFHAGGHYPLNRYNGITAGWVFGDVIGFTSKNAYWLTKISEFGKPDVWSSENVANGISASGYLNDVDFWKGITNQLTPKGVTAGFLAPNNLFVAFSGSKIFVNDLNKGQWIISKEISELNDNEPFAFLKTAPLPQLTEIDAAFYNEGANEYVFMSKLGWSAYKTSNKIWMFGSLSAECYNANTAYLESKKNTVCGTLYNPVCGADGITYNNSCRAKVVGVECYKSGICY